MRGAGHNASSPAGPPVRGAHAPDGRGSGMTRRYDMTAQGFAVWADYPDRPGRVEVHVGPFWMVVGLGGRRGRITVTVEGRGVRVEAWER